MIENIDFDIDRHNQWVEISSEIKQFVNKDISLLAVMRIQSLGKLDSKIIHEESIITKTGKPSDLFGDMSWFISLTDLWTMGSYELIRTLNAIINPNRSNGDYMNKALHELKNEFENIRVPLAKFEPPKNRRNNAQITMLWPAFIPNSGFGWCVSEQDIVKRVDLSNSMIKTFKALFVEK